jgi:hypothetical protein
MIPVVDVSLIRRLGIIKLMWEIKHDVANRFLFPFIPSAAITRERLRVSGAFFQD